MTSVHEARKALYMEGYGKIERILVRCIEEKQLPANLDTRGKLMLGSGLWIRQG